MEELTGELSPETGAALNGELSPETRYIQGPPGPAGLVGNIHIFDAGGGDFDPAALDYSRYSAGDVILVVQDMGG